MRWLKQEIYRLGNNDLWMAIAASLIAALMIVAATEALGRSLY